MSKASFRIGRVTNIKKLHIAEGRRRGSKYDDLAAQMGKSLKKVGDSIPVDLPKGAKAALFHNRINSAFRHNPPKLPSGLSWRKNTILNTKGESIGVAITAVSGSAKRPGKKAKARK